MSEWGWANDAISSLSGHMRRTLSAVMALWPVIFYSLDAEYILKTQN